MILRLSLSDNDYRYANGLLTERPDGVARLTLEKKSYCNLYLLIYTQPPKDTAEGMLRSVLQKVFENAGGPIDHIPPCMYEFEIHSSKRMDDRENATTRFANMPSLINLGN